jgi:PAS domain S-box-containing protein
MDNADVSSETPSEKRVILVADPDAQSRKIMASQIRVLEYLCEETETYLETLQRVKEEAFDAICVDISMRGDNGEDLLSEITKSNTMVIATSEKASISEIVGAVKKGAYEFFEKSSDAISLKSILERACRSGDVRSHARKMEELANSLRTGKEGLDNVVRERTRELLEANLELQAEISARKMADELLWNREQLLQKTVDGYPHPTFILDRHHRVISWNKALERFSGILGDEIKGTQGQWKAFYNHERPCMADLLLEEREKDFVQWNYDALTKISEDNGVVESSRFFPERGDSGQWLRLTAVVIHDPKGVPVAAIETVEDITARKNAENELQEAYRSLEERVKERTHELQEANAALLFEIQERKQAEIALEESEKRFMDVLYASNDAILLIDQERFVDCNEATARMLGYAKREDFLMTHPSQLSPPLQPDGKLSFDKANEMMSMAHHKGFHRCEWINRRADGEEFPVEVSLTPINFKGHTVLHCLWRDITEQKRVEAALIESKESYRRLSDDMPLYVLSFKPDGTILYVNTLLASIYNSVAEEQIGSSFFDIVTPENAKDIQERLRSLSPKNPIETHEDRYFLREGGIHWQEWTTRAFFDESGNTVRFQAIGQDISRRKQAEEHIAKVTRQLDLILNSAGEAICGLDTQGFVTFINPSALQVLQYEADEMMGHPFHEMVHQQSGSGTDLQSHKEECPVLATLRDGVMRRVTDEYYLRKDNALVPVEYTTTAISEEGRIQGVVVIFKDVTERKALEGQLLQAQKLESIGQLAAGIAHEINTPVQYVGDNLEFLQFVFEQLWKAQSLYNSLLVDARESSIPRQRILEIESGLEDVDLAYIAEQTPRALEQSREGIQRIAKIVLAMKEFSHPSSQEKAPIDINRSIESTITVARNEWKYVAELTMDFDPLLPNVPCLQGEFNQVVLNIIVNAAHAISETNQSGAGGKGHIGVQTHLDGQWAEIRISDTGPGIPEEVRSRVYDPFFTTKEVGKGTGQGLAIARNVIVRKLGGSLEFETEIGKGTTFIIRLPINEEESNSDDDATSFVH